MNLKRQWPILLLWLVIGAGGTWGLANDDAGKTAPTEPAVNQLTKPEQALFDAVKVGDTDQVKKLIADGVDVNCRPAPEWETPLFVAIEYDRSVIVQLLIDAGADIHAKVGHFRYINGKPCTLNPPVRAYQFALLQNYTSVKVVSILLNAGADVNEVFKKAEALCVESPSRENHAGFSHRMIGMPDSTPLIAVLSKYSLKGYNPIFSKANGDVAIYLIEHGADLTAMSKNRETALQLAISSRYRRAAMLLIEKGVLNHMTLGQKQVAFNMALLTGFVPMMKILKANGVTLPEARNRLLGIAIQRCHLAGIRILLEMGASPVPEHFGDCSLEPPVVEVMTCGRYAVGKPLSYLQDTVHALLKYGADINQSNCRGQYPLGIAISMRQDTIQQNLNQIEMLLSMGADVNRFQAKGPSPLALAIQKKSKKIVELLLNHGADPAHPIRDEYGTTLTPVGFARKLGAQDIVNLLTECQSERKENL